MKMTTPLEEKLMKEFDGKFPFDGAIWCGGNATARSNKRKVKSFLTHALSQVREECVEGILKRVEEMRKTPLNEKRESTADIHNQCIDDIKSLLLESKG